MAVDTAEDREPARQLWSWGVIERALRLWCGVILMTFVTTHLINHAVGVFGVAAMTEVQDWRYLIWHSGPGTVLLYGAALVHVALSLKRVIWRSTWSMPLIEAAQLVSGLLIPWLLLDHVLGTRVVAERADVDISYIHVLRNLWPGLAFSQIVMLLVVWAHGVLGIYFVAKTRGWFRRWRPAMFAAALLVPALAIAGFVAAGREAAVSDIPRRQIADLAYAVFCAGQSVGRWALLAVFGLGALALVGRLALNRARPRLTVRFTGHGEITSRKGPTLLEMSRINQVPHPSSCGGRGRCGTCRVMVLSGADTLPEPVGIEKRLLERIRAPQQVRLACQIRPQHDLVVRTLLPTLATGRRMAWRAEALEWGMDRELTILFADIRGFSTLARRQGAAELAVLLNRLLADMTHAAEQRGGHIATVETDGVMAVFGLEGAPRAGAQAALHAAADILNVIDVASADVGLAVSQPVRVGIGVHHGPVVATEIGNAERGYQLVAIGEPVVIASRLEEVTKEFGVDAVISHEALLAAGHDVAGLRAALVNYKNGTNAVHVSLFADKAALMSLLGRRAAQAHVTLPHAMTPHAMTPPPSSGSA